MKKLLYLSILIISISSCKKDDVISLSGTYTGTFRTVFSNDIKIVDSELLFASKTYKAKKGAVGGGVFSIDQKNKNILFTNQEVYIALAGINVLNGNYSYETKGDSVILTSIPPDVSIQTFAAIGYLQYRLKRSN